MFDELDRLANDRRLTALLERYVSGNAPDRERWQDRVMTWDGATISDVTRWHGELVAFGWIEQNLATSAKLQTGEVLQAYRTTPAGRSALVKAQTLLSEPLRKSA